MDEPEIDRMQRHARWTRGDRCRSLRIAEYRMAERIAVQADLMRASGFEATAQQRGAITKVFDDLEVRYRSAVVQGQRQRLPIVGEYAGNDGQIGALDTVGAELFRQQAIRCCGLGEDE